jgi:hypothetical protein
VRSLFVAALFLTAACWRSSPTPAPTQPTAEAATPPRRRPPPPQDSVLQKMEQFVDDMCGCSDPACTQRVVDEMTRWSQEQAKSGHEAPPMSDEDTKRAMEMGERMGACMQNAMAGSAAGSATP